MLNVAQTPLLVGAWTEPAEDGQPARRKHPRELQEVEKTDEDAPLPGAGPAITASSVRDPNGACPN